MVTDSDLRQAAILCGALNIAMYILDDYPLLADDDIQDLDNIRKIAEDVWEDLACK
jgi:hypothetical protein